MRLFLQDGPGRLQILSRSHVRELRDDGAAKEFLRPLLANPGNLAAVRNALASEHAGIGAPAWNDAELLEHLAGRLVSEGLLVVSCADSYLASLQGTFQASAAAASPPPATTPLQDEQAAKEEKPAQEPEEQHWIEIELLDDEGKPVANELYYVELPDGSSLSGRTDAQGRARVEGVDPGTAKVSFPDLDKKMYEPG
jgi:hypothetical protein